MPFATQAWPLFWQSVLHSCLSIGSCFVHRPLQADYLHDGAQKYHAVKRKLLPATVLLFPSLAIVWRWLAERRPSPVLLTHTEELYPARPEFTRRITRLRPTTTAFLRYLWAPLHLASQCPIRKRTPRRRSDQKPEFAPDNDVVASETPPAAGFSPSTPSLSSAAP